MDLDDPKRLEDLTLISRVSVITELPVKPCPQGGITTAWEECDDGWWAWEGNLYLKIADNPDVQPLSLLNAKAMRIVNGRQSHAQAGWWQLVDRDFIPIEYKVRGWWGGDIAHVREKLGPLENTKDLLTIIDLVAKEWFEKQGI